MKLKLLRKFKVHGNAIGEPILERKIIPSPAVPLQNVGPCSVCKRPLMVAVGQQIRFHKECRKEGRKRFGAAHNVVEVGIGGIVKVTPPADVVGGAE